MTDDELIDAVLQAASPNIEAVVNATLRAGHAIGDLAILLERQPSGQARIRTTSRLEAIRALLADPRLTPNICHHVEEAMNAAKANELPIVLVMREQGSVVAGIRLVAGGFVGAA